MTVSDKSLGHRSTGGGRGPVRWLRALLLLGVAVAAVIGLAGQANAAFSPYVPTATGYAGDCSATEGAYYAGSGGAAIGNSAVTCSYVHSSISMTVRLYRWNGSSWAVAASRTNTYYNVRAVSDFATPGVCGAGTYWYTRIDFNPSGVGAHYVMPQTSNYYDPCGAA